MCGQQLIGRTLKEAASSLICNHNDDDDFSGLPSLSDTLNRSKS